jgi:hypothetical protein
MKSYRESLILLGVGILFFIMIFTIFSALQNDFIYRHTVGNIAKTERKIKGEIKDVKEPFLSITNENLFHWDVVHYERIMKTGYAKEDYYLYAFYPLFPYVWRLSMLDSRWICLLNYIFYILGVLFIFSGFASKYSFKEKAIFFILLISLPSSVVFIMPYSEAVFFLTLAIAMWAYVKERFWIYLLFMVLACMTRRASFLLFGAAIFSSIFLFIKHRNLKLFLKDLWQLCLPVIIGTAAVSFIQYQSGSGSYLTFIKVTDMFASKLAIPTVLKDWSQNSYPLNMAILFVFIPLVVLSIVLSMVKSLRNKNGINYKMDHKKELVVIMAGGYFALAMTFILLFQGGSLNSTFRGIICTPFFIIFLFYLNQTFTSQSYFNKLLLILAIIAEFFFLTGPYTAHPFRLSYISHLLVILFIYAWINIDKITRNRYLFYYVFIWLLFSVTLFVSYFNAFLGDGWIYT